MNAPASMIEINVGPIKVEIHPDRKSLGIAAARAAAQWLHDHIKQHGSARVVFACAPSQNEFLDALIRPEVCGIALAWDKVTLFHMDEYVGLAADHPQNFRTYLREHLLSRIGPCQVHLMPAESADSEEVCRRYADLLAKAPIDLICLGIGENGHLAFNDPPVADFYDPVTVKKVQLDVGCRRQQVNDGCFPSIEQVPRFALTLTLPVFRNARRLSVQVPGPLKAPAVRSALLGPISTACPASILRLHPSIAMFLDTDSAKYLSPYAAPAQSKRV